MNFESIPWKKLTEMTHGETLQVERVRMKKTGITLEGSFDLPALAQMTEEDQVFIAAFMRSHGSIKEMERLFGISYPTVKARLTRVAEQLPFVETIETSRRKELNPGRRSSREQILERLADGEIDVARATKLLREGGES